jgi:hypothetical protein
MLVRLTIAPEMFFTTTTAALGMDVAWAAKLHAHHDPAQVGFVMSVANEAAGRLADMKPQGSC